MTDTLETFEMQAGGDKLKPSDIANRPLLVKVLDFKTGIKTKYDDAAEAVVVDVLDLSTEEIHLGVMWFNAAIKDNLKRYIGKKLPIALVYQQPKAPGGNAYIVPQGLDGENLKAAQAWNDGKPSLFEDTREERGVGLYGSDTPSPSESQPAFNPVEDKPAASAVSSAKMPSAVQPASQPAAASAPAADDDEPPF